MENLYERTNAARDKLCTLSYCNDEFVMLSREEMREIYELFNYYYYETESLQSKESNLKREVKDLKDKLLLKSSWW